MAIIQFPTGIINIELIQSMFPSPIHDGPIKKKRKQINLVSTYPARVHFLFVIACKKSTITLAKAVLRIHIHPRATIENSLDCIKESVRVRDN